MTSALYRLNLGAGPTCGSSSLLPGHSQIARYATLRRTHTYTDMYLDAIDKPATAAVGSTCLCKALFELA